MARITCSEQARFVIETLPAQAREGVARRLDYLERMPRIYALTDDERFPGCRSFWVEPCYRVFYMVAAGGDDIHVVAVAEEEVDSRGDEAE